MNSFERFALWSGNKNNNDFPIVNDLLLENMYINSQGELRPISNAWLYGPVDISIDNASYILFTLYMESAVERGMITTFWDADDNFLLYRSRASDAAHLNKIFYLTVQLQPAFKKLRFSVPKGVSILSISYSTQIRGRYVDTD